MLTRRQRELLEAIIEEFIETAEAVGSIDLPHKYSLKISPATVRNEMATLVKMGYLDKPHSSSGRIPTTMAFKYFLQEILEDLDVLDVRSQATIGEDLFQKRHNLDQLMLSAVRSLNHLTHNAAVALIGERIYHSGLDALLDNPEFQDLKGLKKMLMILESYSDLSSIFNRYKRDEEVRVLIGDEIGHPTLANSAVVFAQIKVHGNEKGYIAIMGPNRMNYRKVIPAIKYITDKISEVLRDWRY